MIREVYYDEKGEPVALKKGYYSVEKEYNNAGKAVRTFYLDEDGALIDTTDKYALTVDEYDDEGHLIYETHFDKNGAQVNLPANFVSARWYYDDSNRIVRQVFLDSSGNPVNTTLLYAVVINEFDEDGHDIYGAWYDAAGMQIDKADKVSCYTKEYLADEEDEDITVVRTRNYDHNGSPVMNSSGYAVIDTFNDQSGKKVGEAYYDKNLNPVCPTGTAYVRYTIETTEDGGTVTKYYNASGSIVKTEEK